MNYKINNKFFKQPVKFLTGASSITCLPLIKLPQIGFLGKSNVGKSSLINMLCNQTLAKISKTPGRTQQINFFSIANQLVLVDFPGYGFAKVPYNKKRHWIPLIIHYIRYNKNLVLINLLIDSRHGINKNDIEIIYLLKNFNINIQFIFTKSDKINITDQYTNAIINNLANLGYYNNMLFTSKKYKKGIKTLQTKLCSIVNNSL